MSVMRQTYQGSMECIIVDDCGTDDSIAIAERMIASYVGHIQFKICHHERNRGLSSARNTGIVAATGDYVYFLDSDDKIAENCIEKLMAGVSQNIAFDVVQGNAKWSPERTSDRLTKNYCISYARSNEEARACFFNEHQLSTAAWNKLCKRSFLLRNNLLFKEGLLWEDFYWTFFLLKYITSIFFISDVTYIHRERPNSIVTGTKRKTKAKHKFIYFQDVLTNLTPHEEKLEMGLVVPEFVNFYSRFVGELPEYKHLYHLFWEKAKEHRD